MMRFVNPARLYHILSLLALVYFIALAPGCSGASPRFRTGGSSAGRPGGSLPPAAGVPPALIKEAAEERSEDDVTVDIDAAFSAITGEEERKALDEISSFLGTPYSLGGEDHSGIDCSGFTAALYSRVYGVTLPHSTSAQYASGSEIDPGERSFGDLVFFRTAGSAPSHVGFYLGENLFAHASVSNGVTISSLESSYYKRRLIGARRVRR